MSESNEASFPGGEAGRRALFRRSLTSDAASRIKLAVKRGVLSQWGEEAVSEAPTAKQADYVSVKGLLQQRLLAELGDEMVLSLREEEVATAVEVFVRRILESEQIPLNEQERGRLADELTEEVIDRRAHV